MVENLYSKCIYEASIGFVCSNVEQIITLISNLMDELNQSARVNSKDTVGPFLKLDSLNGTVMKRPRKTLSWNRLCESARRGGVKASAQDNNTTPKPQRDLCRGHRDGETISLKLIDK